ncbi:EGF like, fibronectin type III and laminin G domains protein pikachurin isoform 2-T5 [Glossina fuscipes fuscipes]
MRKAKDNMMLMHGFILVTILATAKSAEAEITMEAAFQGHCGHTSPCEQLCYEIHDGMYECDCIEGYELNKNGYSCQVINSTSNNDGHSKSDEDVLYQKGASFSAKLANDNSGSNHLSPSYASSSALTSSSSSDESDEDDSIYISDDMSEQQQQQEQEQQQQKVNSNDYYISNENIINNNNYNYNNFNENLNNNNNNNDNDNNGNQNNYDNDKHYQNARQAYRINLSTEKPLNLIIFRNKENRNNLSSPPTSITLTGTPKAAAAIGNGIIPTVMSVPESMLNINIDDLNDYYTKQDMSVYDDVNNNQLNLRPLNRLTYQQQKQQEQQHPITFNNQEHKQFIATSAVNSGQRANRLATADIISDTSSSSDSIQLPLPDLIASKSNELISTNISLNLSSPLQSINEILCGLDCGLEGLCDNTEGMPRCLCPFGKNGNDCLEDVKVRVPKFSTHSWLAFPALRGAYKHVQLRIEFRPESFDGIILLSGERDDLTGDFMALLLNKGFIEFWFDCGSGVGNVRSRETILLNEWNSVIIYRHRWDAWLVLNHGTKVQGRSNGLFSRITFREPVFLGGTGNITGLTKRLPISNGFAGCIRRFVANAHDYKFEEHPLGDVSKGFDIQDCVTDKCFKYPCQHGGKCLPSDQGAMCLCPIGFVGDLCEIRMDLQVPSFNGSSFLRYAPLGDSALIWLELKVILKPEQADGLILYSGAKRHGDFIALALTNGFVEFIFDLGSGPAVVRSEYALAIGQWHTIQISRTARLAVLKIDQLPEIMTVSSNGFWHLSLPENLFVGGVNHVDKLPLDLKSKPFLVGCIQRIEINGHSLAIISEALGGTNIGNCPHACVARPCGPLAECIPQMESYECRCNIYNTQCNREAELSFNRLRKQKVLAKEPQATSKLVAAREAKQHGDDLTQKSGLKIKQKRWQQLVENNEKKKIVNKPYTRWYLQQHKTAQRTMPIAKATATTTKTTTTTTTAKTKATIPTTQTTALTDDTIESINWQALQSLDLITLSDSQDQDKEEKGREDSKDMSEEDEDSDEIEDDIIFENVKAIRERLQREREKKQQEQQQQQQYNYDDKNAQRIGENKHKRRATNHHQSKSLHKQHYHRFHPNHKTTLEDKTQHKLSRLPTHYESFQANTGSDILTFDDPIMVEDQLRELAPTKTDEAEPDEIDDDNDDKYQQKTFVMDASLFDASDGTEEYQRKQFAQDMKRIMANTKGPYVPKMPQLVISEYDYSEELDLTKQNYSDSNDNDNKEESNANDGIVVDNLKLIDVDYTAITPKLLDENRKPTTSITTSTQTQTDWSLLSKFDLDSDQPHHTIGVRKNFGACFAGHDSYFHYNDAETMSQIISYTIDLNLRIKTRSDNGVILWTGKVGSTDRDKDDYLSLGIENGWNARRSIFYQATLRQRHCGLHIRNRLSR